MPIMILVRGLPGSGKTTYAMTNFVPLGFSHIETDMFFENNGVFRYQVGKAQEAVNWCQKKAKELISQNRDLVISNHFTKHWEMGYYLDLAQKNNYEIIVHTCLGAYGASALYPQALLDSMRDAFEY